MTLVRKGGGKEEKEEEGKYGLRRAGMDSHLLNTGNEPMDYYRLLLLRFSSLLHSSLAPPPPSMASPSVPLAREELSRYGDGGVWAGVRHPVTFRVPTDSHQLTKLPSLARPLPLAILAVRTTVLREQLSETNRQVWSAANGVAARLSNRRIAHCSNVSRPPAPAEPPD